MSFSKLHEQRIDAFAQQRGLRHDAVETLTWREGRANEQEQTAHEIEQAFE